MAVFDFLVVKITNFPGKIMGSGLYLNRNIKIKTGGSKTSNSAQSIMHSRVRIAEQKNRNNQIAPVFSK
jgi:hypothetical protein